MYTTKLNKNTKKAKRWIDSYNNSDCYSVSDFYTSRVYRKESIESSIKRKMIENNCHGYKITGGNGFYFSCGYLNKDNTILYIETQSNTYEIAL